MSFEDYQKRRAREVLARYAPKPGDPPSMFMGVSIDELDRDSLVGLINYMGEQALYKAIDLERRLENRRPSWIQRLFSSQEPT